MSKENIENVENAESVENKELFDLEGLEIPTLESLEEELLRERKRRSQSKVLRTIILIILAVIAAVVVVVILVLPIFEISGSAMAHTLNNGDIVVAVKTNVFYNGDIIAYDFNDVTQIKRVIARSGDTVNIEYSASGNVSAIYHTGGAWVFEDINLKINLQPQSGASDTFVRFI